MQNTFSLKGHLKFWESFLLYPTRKQFWVQEVANLTQLVWPLKLWCVTRTLHWFIESVFACLDRFVVLQKISKISSAFSRQMWSFYATEKFSFMKSGLRVNINCNTSSCNSPELVEVVERIGCSSSLSNSHSESVTASFSDLPESSPKSNLSTSLSESFMKESSSCSAV